VSYECRDLDASRRWLPLSERASVEATLAAHEEALLGSSELVTATILRATTRTLRAVAMWVDPDVQLSICDIAGQLEVLLQTLDDLPIADGCCPVCEEVTCDEEAPGGPAAG
jgi:hypothetical protein